MSNPQLHDSQVTKGLLIYLHMNNICAQQANDIDQWIIIVPNTSSCHRNVEEKHLIGNDVITRKGIFKTDVSDFTGSY